MIGMAPDSVATLCDLFVPLLGLGVGGSSVWVHHAVVCSACIIDGRLCWFLLPGLVYLLSIYLSH